MSKFSTDALVDYLNELGVDTENTAIIVRLRAADELCEAAKHRIESSEIGVGCNIGLQKAIKKYEGA